MKQLITRLRRRQQGLLVIGHVEFLAAPRSASAASEDEPDF